MAPIHDRMPVILQSEAGRNGSGEEPTNDNELKSMLKPFPSERVSVWPVGKAVGNVKNDAPELIERAAVQDALI